METWGFDKKRRKKWAWIYKLPLFPLLILAYLQDKLSICWVPVHDDVDTSINAGSADITFNGRDISAKVHEQVYEFQRFIT